MAQRDEAETSSELEQLAVRLRQAERERDEARGDFRALFDAMNDGYCRVELRFDEHARPLDFRFLEVNRTFEELTGLEAVEGRWVREVAPGLEEYWYEIYGEIALSGVSRRFENRASTLGRFYDVCAYRSGLPEARQVVIVFRDISAQRLQEGSLLSAAARTSALVALSDRFRELTDPIELAYAASEVLGRTLNASRCGYGTVDLENELVRIERDWRQPGVLSLAGLHRFRAYGDYIEEMKRGQTVVFSDTETDPRTRGRTESLRAIGVQAMVNVPIMEHGRMVALLYLNHATPRDWSTEELGFIRDVAERARAAVERWRVEAALRASEESLRLAVGAGDISTWVWDLSTNLVRIDERVIALFGLPASESREVPLFAFFEHIQAEDRERVSGAISHVVEGGGDFSVEFRVQRPDGSLRWVQSSGAITENVEGRPSRVAGAIINIHHRKMAEESLMLADRRKDEFLATLAHELRNPLAPLRSALAALRLPGTDPRSAEHARDVMERQVGQMVRLIDDLMDVSRISRGQIELRREQIELEHAIQQAVEISRPLLDAREQRLEVALPREPIWVHADLVRLTQVLSNLLNNAAKFSALGGRIDLIAERAGSTASIVVRDSGIGIPREMLPRVFEMFTQVDSSLERTRGGLGIGLALVKGIIELHGGTVSAQSDGRGAGSEFRVTLPAVHGSEMATGTEPARTAAARSKAPRRVLIADDNHDTAEMASMLLEMLGHETRIAHDGVEALAIADAFEPEVVFLDIGMPRLNGYDTCRQLRERPWAKRTLIVACSGWGQEEDRRKSRDAGFDHHLVKPVSPELITSLLE